MKNLNAAFITECMKLKRATIFWIILLIFIFIPLMMGLIMFVANNPEMASKLGMIGSKATMVRVGKADWSAYFGLLTQSIAGIGLVGFGFVTSWVFGREYSDHTIKDILALPVSRTSIVISKFLVIFLWCTLLIVVLFASGIFIGKIIHLSGWSHEIVFQFVYKFLFTSLFTLTLSTPVAFFASYSRGYLLPM
jgi:ABC-2 type transport system permease protein